ncbi:hypothetical protein CY34DRAFT_110005, partial [Suillus luteus UH-Slu-Lm8-n1]
MLGCLKFGLPPLAIERDEGAVFGINQSIRVNRYYRQRRKFNMKFEVGKGERTYISFFLKLFLNDSVKFSMGKAHDLFERYSGQISAVKKIAEQQKEADFVVAEAERKKAKGKQKVGNLTDNPMESERDTAETDAEGEEKEDPPAEARAPKKPKRLRRDKKSVPYVLVGSEAAPAKAKVGRMSVPSKTVGHAKKCERCTKMDLKCFGIPGLCCSPCRDAKSSCLHSSQHGKRKGSKAAAKAPSTTGTAGTSKSVPVETTIELSEDEGPPPAVRPAKKAKEATPI